MTILVGVLCKDGVIIGADGSATFGAGQMRTIEQPIDKLKGTGAAPEVPKPAASVTVTPTAQPASVLAGSITP